MVAENRVINHSERVSAEVVDTNEARKIKLRVETYNDGLGWYSSGSLMLGIEQLPLLEQAISQMRQMERARENHSCVILPFPGITEEERDCGARI